MDIYQKPPDPVSYSKWHNGLELSGKTLMWSTVAEEGQNLEDE